MQMSEEYWINDNAEGDGTLSVSKTPWYGYKQAILKSAYDQLLADARELQKALERARDRDFDWDLVHTKHSMEQLQVWRGKCLDALETFTKKYGSAE